MKNSSIKKPYIFRNRTVDKSQLKKLISWSFSNYGLAKATRVADSLKDLGFSYATKAGISLSIEDLKVPETKRFLIEDTFNWITDTESKFSSGQITSVERFQKVIDTWNTTSESLKEEVVQYFKETDPLNSIYIMAFSGARGNISQVRQLVGMRGLMSDPQGQIIDLPIKSNFREGLNVTEYIISSYGARKGLVDTALRTADSGYLTRRLVDVAQDIIVREVDCNTVKGLTVSPDESLIGRVLLDDIVDPKTNEKIGIANTEITSYKLDQFKQKNIQKLTIRSALTCESLRSICQRCYGWNLSSGKMVDLGEAVGIVAAQSIGEPGTQLTMRTFHTGGVFTGDSAGQVRASHNGTIRIKSSFKSQYTRTRHGDDAYLLENPLTIELYTEEEETIEIELKPETVLLVKDNQKVLSNQIIAESVIQGQITERATKDILSNISGEISFGNLIVEERVDKQGNRTSVNQKSGLIWLLSGDVYDIPSNTTLLLPKNRQTERKSVLAKARFTNAISGKLNSFLTSSTPSPELVNVISSLTLEHAKITQTINGPILKFEQDDTEFSFVNSLANIKDSQVIAEQIDCKYATSTGGIIFFKENQEADSFLWVPEETYEINKDSSLLLVEDKSIIESGTEIIREIHSKNSGFIQVTEQNNILRELSIKPGSLYSLDCITDFLVENESLIEPGQEIANGIITENLTYVELIQDSEGNNAILARPVHTFKVPKEEDLILKQTYSKNLARFIKLKLVKELPFKNTIYIKSNSKIDLVKISLVLEVGKELHDLISSNNHKIEIRPNILDENISQNNLESKFKIVVTENLSAITESNNKDITSTNTTLVDPNQYLKPTTIINQQSVVSLTKGRIKKIETENNVAKKVLITSNSDEKFISVKNKITLKTGDFLKFNEKNRAGTIIGQVLFKQGSHYKIRKAYPYLISQDAVLNVYHGNLIQQRDRLAVLVFERPKTGDIVQGLPRIEEILEGRKPKESCKLAPLNGIVSIDINSDEKNITITNEAESINLSLKTKQRLIVSNSDSVYLGQPLTDGNLNPHDLLSVYFSYYKEKYGTFEGSRLSLQKIQLFLAEEIQNVYRSQGVSISDKHVEVIVRQMTSKVRVVSGGITTLLPDELVDLHQLKRFEKANTLDENSPAEYLPVLLGITKASLNTDSFISAASFQETTRILTDAAIEGKTDWLRGLKENVIIGRLIPAGTGFDNLYSESRIVNKDRKQITETPNTLDQISGNFDDIILDDRTARILNDN
uniref:DNA-directed RNA polymerase subunit beta'' n=1 Tax=Haptophyceae sp. NIES-3900 TaxID=2748608 RepID=A0A7R6WD50_9EUKA|nr:RNA polymerase b''-subunit [Haptophyceae sp. NIES-3900]